MNAQTETTVTEVTTPAVDSTAEVAATTTLAAPAAPAVPKAPSKKSLALAIFSAALAKRKEGGFDSNKAFRAAVLAQIQTDLGVTIASAATMYNAAKQEAEAADATVALGRDPKKEKAVAGTGKRGRPAGSKNKAKEAAPAAATAETAPAAEVDPSTVVEPGVVLTAVEGQPEAEVETAPAEAPAEAEATA